MTYEEKKKVIDAAIVLKEYGKSRANGERMFTCPGCLFQRINEGGCCLKSCPCDWTIPILTRWTPEDVTLAKALKAFGAITIKRWATGYVTWEDKDGRSGYLPPTSFENLQKSNEISINSIIEEAEG